MCTEEDLKRYRYLTIYKSDYEVKKGKGLFRPSTKQEYKDPIAESFKHYLEIEDPDIEPPIEDGDLYLEKVKSRSPKISKMYLDKPLDHCTIKKSRLYQGKTVYQVDYCDVEEDMRRKILEAENRKVQLPDDWVIPLTTQKYDFRDPLVLSSHAYDPTPQIRPPNNLDPNGTTGQAGRNGVR
ncbi:hypothetical protein NQ318_013006 [Aromia moschata]|uniref:Uncharacterized protein n=1 Tax=Aromia moschata TaxID=1265417 RepID=A0AAV8XV92_9CUCU|nr:hypothetical protein NQ318_013006 [Aromia moschata]